MRPVNFNGKDEAGNPLHVGKGGFFQKTRGWLMDVYCDTILPSFELSIAVPSFVCGSLASQSLHRSKTYIRMYIHECFPQELPSLHVSIDNFAPLVAKKLSHANTSCLTKTT